MLFEHAFGFAFDLVLYSRRGLVFEGHRVCHGPHVLFGFRANTGFRELLERSIFWNNRIHEFAIERFRVVAQCLQRASICGSRCLTSIGHVMLATPSPTIFMSTSIKRPI